MYAGFEVVGIHQQKFYLQRGDLKLISDEHHWIFVEIFGCQTYSGYRWFLQCEDDFVVFDLGMNRGYATLYFAEDSRCLKVYGFEPVKETFDRAQVNIALNPHLEGKIAVHNFGLGKNAETVTLFMSAQSVAEDGRPNSRDGGASIHRAIVEENEHTQAISSCQAEIRHAADCISEILAK